jgi:XTP/dITP diphosphohydrolase
MKDILIATTNEGKFHEISSFCKDLPYNFLKLQNLGLENEVVEEPFLTTAENAIQKARFFAEKSSLPTIAEDTGFFVEYLNGEPGVHAKRYAPTEKERNENILNALQGVEKNKRKAYFENSTCFFDLTTSSFSVFKGVVKGLISEKVNTESRTGMGYDSIFFYEPLQKNFSELSIAEKNLVSHRGQALAKLKAALAAVN